MWRLPPGEVFDAPGQDAKEKKNGICDRKEKRDASTSGSSPLVEATSPVSAPTETARGGNCELSGKDQNQEGTATSLSSSSGGPGEGEAKNAPRRLAAYLRRTSVHSGRPWVDAVVTDPPYGMYSSTCQCCRHYGAAVGYSDRGSPPLLCRSEGASFPWAPCDADTCIQTLEERGRLSQVESRARTYPLRC